jgi:hypothetical protein
VCPTTLQHNQGVKLDKEHWYEHVPKSAETSHEAKVTILWYQQVHIDRTIPNTVPHIIIHDKQKGTCVLTDVAISGDKSVIKKEAEKILKYKDLTIEIQCMWNVQTSMIPVLIRATGTISKSFRKYLSNIPGKYETKELQKTTILGTAHILQKVLMYMYSRFNTGDSIICTMTSNYRIAATWYSLGMWFVSGI